MTDALRIEMEPFGYVFIPIHTSVWKERENTACKKLTGAESKLY